MKRTWKMVGAMLMAGTVLLGSLTGCGKQTSAEEESKDSIETEQQTGQSQQETEESEEVVEGPITTDPITISVLTTRQASATNDASDLWYFKYLEYWMNQQGYNITIDVQQTLEPDQQIPLLLGTDNLPDLVWGIQLSATNAVKYGVEEGQILDWTPYLNEKYMPTLYGLLQEKEEALAASICLNGAIYGLPYLTERSYGTSTGTMGSIERVYIDQRWLDQCGLEVPKNLDEFLDMLRAFKENVELEGGQEVVPLINNADFFERYLWMGLGFYGSTIGKYGTTFSIKDEEVVLPAATEEYRTFIEIMNTCYEEGLISPDYFSMTTETANALMSQGVCGVMCDYTLTSANSFEDMVSALPITIGDNDQVVVSAGAAYRNSTVWASAKTEYPEVLAVIMDYVYSDEGSALYNYGPMQGEDPLDMLDGWYINEDGNLTASLVEDGTFTSYEEYVRQYVYSGMYVGNVCNALAFVREHAGLEPVYGKYTYQDAITGDNVSTVVKKEYKDDNADGKWRLIDMEAWADHVTVVALPAVYMSEEDAVRAGDLKTVLESYIAAESAKFITGLRPLDELDDYFKELEKMDIEEYIALYQDAYTPYINSIFN